MKNKKKVFGESFKILIFKEIKMTTELIIQNAPDFSTPEKTQKTLLEAMKAMQTLQSVVKENLTTYSPENFKTIEETKKARAELNASATKINEIRKSYEKEYLKAFSDFKNLSKETIDLIEECSGKLDEIVKQKENEEKQANKPSSSSASFTVFFGTFSSKTFVDSFSPTDFSLFSLEKVFNEKWLNKTVKMTEIKKAIDELQNKTLADLKTLEAITQDETVKAFYLDCLDIGIAIQKAKDIEEKKRLAEEEKQKRIERETTEKLVQQRKEETTTFEEQEIEKLAINSLRQQGKTVDTDPIETYTLRFRGKRSQLHALKRYMTENGIIYDKVE